MSTMRIVIVGAGSIGCYLGGRLATNPAVHVTLIGRPTIAYAVRGHGLSVGTPDGPRTTIPADRLEFVTELAATADPDVVLVTVKAKDTATVGAELATSLPTQVPILCLQNGLRGAETLATAMPEHRVLAGMVAFNVVREEPATFLQTTSGEVMVDADPALQSLIAAAGASRPPLTLVPRDDMPNVHAAKLLLNLNNAINALSGIPLKAELSDGDFRRVLAASQREALAVYAGCGISPAKLTPVPPAAMTRILETPTPIFTLLARTALSVHPKARSSMADDLDQGRPTEIAQLQGEISSLGRAHGIPTPVNDALVDLVQDAEAAGPGRRNWTGPALLAEVRRRH
mgnify:FL=1